MRHFACLTVCIAALTGTLIAPVAAAATLPGSSIEASGFLGDYADLAKAPGPADSWQWVRPGVDWKSFDKIMLQPIEVWINPQAAYPGIQPDVYKQMTDNFRDVLIGVFRDGGYKIVDQQGPGVLRVHLALTGITPERPSLTPLDILPIKLAFDVARRATGTDKTVIVVSGEFEVLDGATGQRVFAQVTTKKDAHRFVGQNLTWDEVRNAATTWANQARTRLDAARAAAR